MKPTASLAAVLLLSAALTLTSALPATATDAPAAETPVAEALPGGPLAQLVFTGSMKTLDAVRKYPFLKESMQGISGDTNWATADIKAGKIQFLFFYLNSESETGECGFLGCPMTVWANEGKGFFQVMDILNKYTNTVTYVHKDGDMTLYFCDVSRGLSTWHYENSQFQHKKADEQTPECNIKKFDGGFVAEPGGMLMPGMEGYKPVPPSVAPATKGED